MGGPGSVVDDRTWRIAGAVVLALAVAVGVGIGFLGGAEPLPPESVVPADPAGAGQPGPEIVVHVAGAVVEPGLVHLPPDSRVADAIAAAGGLSIDALETAINLAAPLADGAQVVVPSATDGADGTGAAADDGLVHVNQATAADLERLPGVGPVLAQRIVDHRDDDGPFQSVEDLLDVPGIGESKLAAMRDHLSIP